MKTNSLDFDAQALREKILDLAMRGKLVPQDPDDEPASVLLEKIKAEKAELIKEKKIKKSKPLPPITDDEKPFDIPDSWEWVRLGDVAQIEMGQAPKSSTVNQNQNGIEFHQGKTEFSDEIIKKSNKFTTLDNKIVDKDYILMAVRAPVGDVNLLDRNIYIGRGLAGIKGYIIDKNYLFRYLMSDKAYYEAHSSGSTFKAINGNIIKNTPVPLPPLSEQSRIAAKIAQLFALLRKVESSTQQYAKLQALLKSKVLDLAMRGKLVKQDPNDEPASVLLKKIKAEKSELIKEKKIKKTKPLPPITDAEKPFAIPDSWEWVRLGDVCNLKNGKTPKKEDISNDNIYPYFKVKDMNNNELYMEKVKAYVGKKYERQVMPKNTIIFPKNGGAVLTAKKRILLKNSLVDLNTGGLVSFNNFNYKFLYYIFSSFKIVDFVKGSAVPTINSKKLKETLVPLPPLLEQSRIVDKLAQLLNNMQNFKFF